MTAAPQDRNTVDWPDELIDWMSMTEPPALHTVVRGHDGDDDEADVEKKRKEPFEPTVVITLGEDFPDLAAKWGAAPPEQRAECFWALGLAHIAEVELVRLPPELRPEAVARVGEVRRDNPRTAASDVVRILREARLGHPEVKFRDRPPVPRADLVAHQRLHAIRASGSYSGLGPEAGVRFVHLAAGLLPVASEQDRRTCHQ